MKTFATIKDKALRAKLEAVVREHEAPQGIRPEVDQYPRFVFSRATPRRGVGEMVQVRCGLEPEPRGGTITGVVGRAYLVDVEGTELLVHEPDDAWVM